MRYKDKKVRECAQVILENLMLGKAKEAVTGFPPKIVALAYKLLKFEKLIRKSQDYELTGEGKQHIAKHGNILYPRE